MALQSPNYRPASSSNSSPSPRRRPNWLLISSIAVGIFSLLLIVAFFQQGGYLQSRVLSGEITETNPGDVLYQEPGGENQQQAISAKRQEVCEREQQLHVDECGNRAPEEDYDCRTTEAEDVFAECLQNISDEEAANIIDIEQGFISEDNTNI